MKKLLTICPTKNRPDKCKTMLTSFNGTAWVSDIVFILDNNERDKAAYKELFLYSECTCHFMPPSNITKQMNDLLKLKAFQGYEYYHITNDDFVYKTHLWDLKLIDKIESKKGYGIAYGDDTVGGIKLPTAPLISGNIIKALGWIQMPRLTHLYGDSVWKAIGHKLNMLYYCGEVVIEHRHAQKDTKYRDDVYNFTNSQEMYRRDHEAVKEWIANEYNDDIKKIVRAVK